MAGNSAGFGEIWPGWVMGEKIGKGSFGTVRKAAFTNPDGTLQLAAVKHIRIPAKAQEDDDLVADDVRRSKYRAELNNLMREVETMRELRGSRFLVGYHDHKVYGSADGLRYDVFIRMELLTPLNNWTDSLGRCMGLGELLPLAMHMCQALMVMQEKHRIHRDIKPANVFFDPVTGVFKLGDFGTARVLSSAGGASTQIGTPNYMAPEIYIGRHSYDQTVDTYSLGIMMYRYLNYNRFPYMTADSPAASTALFKRVQNTEPMPAPEDCDARLAAITMKCIAYNPADRYASAAELYKDLLDYYYTLTPEQLAAPLHYAPAGASQSPSGLSGKPTGSSGSDLPKDSVPVHTHTDTAQPAPGSFSQTAGGSQTGNAVPVKPHTDTVLPSAGSFSQTAGGSQTGNVTPVKPHTDTVLPSAGSFSQTAGGSQTGNAAPVKPHTDTVLPDPNHLQGQKPFTVPGAAQSEAKPFTVPGMIQGETKPVAAQTPAAPVPAPKPAGAPAPAPAAAAGSTAWTAWLFGPVGRYVLAGGGAVAAIAAIIGLILTLMSKNEMDALGKSQTPMIIGIAVAAILAVILILLAVKAFLSGPRVPAPGITLTKGLPADKQSLYSQEILMAQQHLKNLGYYPFELKEEFDLNMQTAVRAFQRYNGQRMTGELDTATWNALFSRKARSLPENADLTSV